jgi:protein-tyrosine-phosphatase
VTAHGRVLFLCPHNAAKSMLAIAKFNRLAQQRGLSLRADSAGKEPDAAPSPAVVAPSSRMVST